MMTSSGLYDQLKSICRHWSEALQPVSDTDQKATYVQENLPELLLNKSLFRSILTDIQEGAAYPDIRRGTMFDNEILLYLDPRKQFSIRLYIWPPGEFTPIHDHSSWGVIGAVSETLEIIKYTRTDDGSQSGYAHLEKKDRLILTPGRSDITLPLNQGIHKTGNPGKVNSVTLHLYGKPIRRSYINQFDPVSGSVRPIYPPKIYKKMLASEALKGFD